MRSSRSWLVVILAVFLLLLASCSKEKKDWELAEQTGTSEAYQQFIDVHPESTFVDVARLQIEENAYRDAMKSNEIDSIRAFCETYPASQYVKNATTKLEGLVYETAEKAATVEALEAYLEEFQSGVHEANAKTNLQRMRWGFTIRTDEAFVQNQLSGITHSWGISNAKKYKGVIVSATFDFTKGETDVDTSAMFVAYKTTEGKDRAICAGVAFTMGESDESSFWMFNDEGRFMSVNKTTEGEQHFHFLFVIPVEVESVTLIFREEEVGTVAIKPKKQEEA